MTVGTTLAPAIGPVLGGFLVTDFSWRWVFFVNLPIGIVAVVFGALFLERTAAPPRAVGRSRVHPRRRRLRLAHVRRWRGPVSGWGSAKIIGSLVAGALLLGVLVYVELHDRAPMLRLRLLGNRLFRSTTVVMAVGTAAFLGVLFVVPLFFQIGLGLSALQSGLNTFPEALGVMVGAQIGTRALYRRVGPRRCSAAGLVGVAVSVALMALVGRGTDLWWMRLLMFTMGLAQAQLIISAQAASFATISRADTGSASSLFNMGRQIGSALGVAVLSTVIAAVGATQLVAGRLAPSLTGYHVAFLVAAAMALVASGTAFVSISDADAVATMRRPAPRRHPAPEPVGMAVPGAETP